MAGITYTRQTGPWRDVADDTAVCSPDAGGHVEINQRREVVWVDALIEDAEGAEAVIEILRRYIDTGSIAPKG